MNPNDNDSDEDERGDLNLDDIPDEELEDLSAEPEEVKEISNDVEKTKLPSLTFSKDQAVTHQLARTMNAWLRGCFSDYYTFSFV